MSIFYKKKIVNNDSPVFDTQQSIHCLLLLLLFFFCFYFILLFLPLNFIASFILFFFKAHHQREENIQRLYLHRSRLNSDKYLLSEEARVRIFSLRLNH